MRFTAADSTAHPCLIMGLAPCVWQDVDCLPKGVRFDILAINAMSTLYLEPILGIVTEHGEKLNEWIKLRKARGGDMRFFTFGPRGEPDSGSSALLGVRVAQALGYRRIVLAGVPLAGVESFGIEHEILTTGGQNRGGSYSMFRVGWEEGIDALRDEVRSMSGWTRELLGEPSAAWLKGGSS